MPPVTFDLPDEAATAELARRLAAMAHTGDVFALSGDLGAGKTAFARAFIRHLAEDEAEDVPSPTFTLVQLYETETGIIWHFDLYRLRHPQDALELGIEEAFSEGICLVEWPDRLGIHLPRDRVDVTFQHAGGNHRRVLLEGRGEWGRRIEELQTHG